MRCSSDRMKIQAMENCDATPERTFLFFPESVRLESERTGKSDKRLKRGTNLGRERFFQNYSRKKLRKTFFRRITERQVLKVRIFSPDFAGRFSPVLNLTWQLRIRLRRRLRRTLRIGRSNGEERKRRLAGSNHFSDVRDAPSAILSEERTGFEFFKRGDALRAHRRLQVGEGFVVADAMRNGESHI